MVKVAIKGEYIKLGQFLKLTHLIQSGGEEKTFLLNSPVFVNGKKEQRRGRKLYPNDKIVVVTKTYLITCE